MRQHILTGNRTSDGAPLYLGQDEVWHTHMDTVAIFDHAQDAEAALAQARRQERDLCDPYLLAITIVDGTVTLPSQREIIRAGGDAVVLTRLGYPVDVKVEETDNVSL